MLSRQALIAFALAALPLPAMALSCISPDIDRLWTRAADSPDTYMVGLGSLSFDPDRLPRPEVTADAPERSLVPARFEGALLTQGGFDAPRAMDVTLEVGCIGPWCGGAQPDEELIAFLRQGPHGWAVELSPCGGMVWPRPDAQVTERLQACMNGADCTAAP